MKQLQVTLPNAVVADLFYMDDFPSGGAFDYIQLARTNSLFLKHNLHQIEETYWKDLEKNRTDFASQIPSDFDLIIDAPSNSGWHRPYSSAVRRAFSTIPCINFIKETNKPGVKAFKDIATGWAQATRVLIVDDVFNTGKIAASVIDKLQQYGTNTAATFMIACPLRMPPQPGGSIDEMNEAMEEIFGKKSDPDVVKP